jgi:putative serine protease PepD
MMRALRLFRVAVVAAGSVLLLAGCAAGSPPTAGFTGVSAGAVAAPVNAAALEQAYVGVVARVLPSVVQITTDGGLGAGVVFDGKGDIVTNAHVVGLATTFQVRLANSPATYPAHLVDAYPPDDLAMIKLDSPRTGSIPPTSATRPNCPPVTSSWRWATHWV